MIKRLWFRFVEGFGVNPIGSKIFSRLGPPIDRLLLRVTRGRYSMVLGKPIGLLKTTGRKSGEERSTPLLYARSGDEIVLIASNFGKTHHPAWYLNLTANPQVKFVYDGREEIFTARIAGPEEREFYWQKALVNYQGYDIYEERAGDRNIPVVVLTPMQ
jgi:deazaflavin-dependent oxidoreductase (nitroreductase family)